RHRASRLQLLAGVGRAVVETAGGEKIRGGPTRDGACRFAIPVVVGRDGAVHGRRWIPGQTVHGVGRTRLEPLSSAHTGRAGTFSRESASDAGPVRRARDCWWITRGDFLHPIELASILDRARCGV